MKKEVLVTITGLQFIQEDDDMEPVEVVTPGKYYRKNGHHYVLYDDLVEGFQEVTHNTLKFSDQSLEVIRRGPVNVQMHFEENKKTVSFYQTPFGMLNMGVSATNLQLKESEDRISLEVDYALDINESFVADCHILLDVVSKETGSLCLES